MYMHKKRRISIARVDIAKKYAFVERENIRSDNLPSIVVYFDGNYYLYEGNKDSKEELLHFINKIINPIVPLKTDDEVENFLNLNLEHVEKTKFFEK